MSTVFKAKSPVLVSDGQTPPNPFVVHMFYLSRRNNEKLADFGEDVAVITGNVNFYLNILLFTCLRRS
jgi:hypothetical protein